MLYADTRGEGSEVLAGGMDLATAERLCAQVTEILGDVTDAPARHMQPGDLWLTEATPGKYELRRNIEAGHEIAASPRHPTTWFRRFPLRSSLPATRPCGSASSRTAARRSACRATECPVRSERSAYCRDRTNRIERRRS